MKARSNWTAHTGERFRQWMREPDHDMLPMDELDEHQFHDQLGLVFGAAGGKPTDFAAWLQWATKIPKWDTYSWRDRLRMAWMAGEESVREPRVFSDRVGAE